MTTRSVNLPRRHKLTVTDYYRLAAARSLNEGDRVELIEGELIDKTPIGSRHASRVSYLTQLLLRAVSDRALVWTQNPTRLGTYSEPQPDVMLLKPKEDFYSSAHPGPEHVLLIVEVAETSLTYDRDVKVPLYARHGIPEVWLVDLNCDRLTVFQQPGQEGYRMLASPEVPGETAVSALPDLYVDLRKLFRP